MNTDKDLDGTFTDEPCVCLEEGTSARVYVKAHPVHLGTHGQSIRYEGNAAEQIMNDALAAGIIQRVDLQRVRKPVLWVYIPEPFPSGPLTLKT